MVPTFNSNSQQTNDAHTLNLQASIPTELGKLSNLIYLRLSYNAFTGTVPEGLAEMKGLQLLQLQSNRITKIPIIPRLDDIIHGQSTFVTDCGVPSAFDNALECDNCTMCCKYYSAAELGLKNYGTSAAALLTCFIALCCMVAFLLYITARCRNIGNTVTSEIETRIKEDDKYALSKIGKDSVYSYFVTDKKPTCEMTEPIYNSPGNVLATLMCVTKNPI
eukprot:scaffold34668_cov189-Skeletonema_dohrnii-CCMP3373.AAC.4